MTEVKLGVLPYDDGSGNAFDITVDKNGSAWLETSSQNWVVVDHDEWPALRSAMNQAFRSHAKLASTSHTDTRN